MELELVVTWLFDVCFDEIWIGGNLTAVLEPILSL